MTSPQDYQAQIKEILGVPSESGAINLQFKWDTPIEVRQERVRIQYMQKQLRLLKKDIAVTIKSIRSEFTAKKAGIGKGVSAGLGAAIFGKKAVGKMNAIDRENWRQLESKAIAPYQTLSRTVDDILLKLDGVKMEMEQSILSESTSKGSDSQ
jgi:hypothetical protein